MVIPSNFVNGALLAREHIRDHVHLVVVCIQCTVQGIMRNVLEVALVLEPGACGTNMVGCALALDLEEHLQILKLTFGTGAEGLEYLKTGRLGVDINLDRRVGLADIGGRVREVAWDEAVLGQVVAVGGLQHELVAGCIGQWVGQGVEGQLSRQGHSCDELGGSQKVHGGRVAIVAVLEVSVERGQDGVLFLRVQVIACPLLVIQKRRDSLLAKTYNLLV